MTSKKIATVSRHPPSSLPALFGYTPMSEGHERYEANSRLQAYQAQRLSEIRGRPIEAWFANLPEGEEILRGQRVLYAGEMTWPSELILCPICWGQEKCPCCQGSRVTTEKAAAKFNSQLVKKLVLVSVTFSEYTSEDSKEGEQMSGQVTLRIQPWRVYLKTFAWTKEEDKKKFLPRFAKHKEDLQAFLDTEAEFTLPFIPKVNRSAVLSRDVEAFLKGQSLTQFTVTPNLLQDGGGVQVSDDKYGQALLVKIDPKGTIREKIVERSIKMPATKVVKKKKRARSGDDLVVRSRKVKKLAQAKATEETTKKMAASGKTKKAKAEKAPRKERPLAGSLSKVQITDAIDALLVKTSPKEGFTRDVIMGQLGAQKQFASLDKGGQDAIFRVLINYLWELMEAGKVVKLSRREYGFKGGTGTGMPSVKKVKTAEPEPKKVKKVKTAEPEPKKVKKTKKTKTAEPEPKKVKKSE